MAYQKNRASGALMVALFAAASLGPVVAQAAGGPADAGFLKWASDPVVEQANKFMESKDFTGAASYLKGELAKKPDSADYNNLYAFAVRKGPNPDMTLVFKHYNEALRIDPKHRGAHEYIGEAYLMVKDVAKAKEHLATLDNLCTFGCEEYTDLKKAIAEYEAKTK
jgi:Tfp pilus assembly protein PilF